MEIYAPSEDSFFFLDFLKKYLAELKNKNISYIDIGTGSGILAETAESSGIRNITATDINFQAVKKLKSKKTKIKVIKSDLFSSSKLKNKKFDLITFNAPYLPEDNLEPKDSQIATTGGKRGDEISLRFLKQAKEHLKPKGRIFLLVSSLTPQNQIRKLKPRLVAKKKLFFEELFIFEISHL